MRMRLLSSVLFSLMVGWYLLTPNSHGGVPYSLWTV